MNIVEYVCAMCYVCVLYVSLMNDNMCFSCFDFIRIVF